METLWPKKTFFQLEGFADNTIFNFHSFNKIMILLLLNMLLQYLKVQSWKLYNKKHMIASTQITNTGIFAFIAVLVSKLLSREVLFINRKNN